MKTLYEKISFNCSKNITKTYSTSFSLGVRLLSQKIRKHIYAIYGFVRLADEIVDSFDGYKQEELLLELEKNTYKAIENGISVNPVLQSFQETVNTYHIELELIDLFLRSMKMDLSNISYNETTYKAYILGSAEVVGLMCLHVFVEGNMKKYEELKPYAMKLGSVFQKVNFLRDISFDYNELNRTYFPNADINNLSEGELINIFKDIENEFDEALIGIKKLPNSCKFGVYLAYKYYRKLFKKIKRTETQKLLENRIRIHNGRKAVILVKSAIRHQLNLY